MNKLPGLTRSVALACVLALVARLAVFFYLIAFPVLNESGDRPMLTLGIMLVLVGVIMVGQGLLGELLTRVLHQSGGKAQYLMKPKRRLEF